MSDIFGFNTLRQSKKLYGDIRPHARAMGVDPFLAVGGPAEEMHTRNERNTIWALGEVSLDVMATNWSHEGIVQDLIDSKGVDQTNGVSPIDKARHATLLDMGVANIKLQTAIELLNDYNNNYQKSDPLDLKKYNADYSKSEVARAEKSKLSPALRVTS
jgi:hypothetical protein